MIASHDIRLAVPGDASRIAQMSRDFIEHGLGWRWTSGAVLQSIRERATNVAVVHERSELVGFAIMQYHDDEAHLLLLAVAAAQRRKGVGTALVKWLEAAALTGGIGIIYVEARAGNHAARAFYRQLGYKEIKFVRNYYRGQENGVRIAKDLWI